MHVLKGLIHLWLSPLLPSLAAAAVAAALYASGWRRTASALALGALGTLYLGSTALVGDALLGPLERRFPAFSPDRALPDVHYVVVLGSGYSPADGIPVTAAINEDGLVRIVEAVRICRRLGDVRLVVSGGAPRPQTPSARGYAILAEELGIDPAAMDILDTPFDTREEAREIGKLIGTARFVAVTSAYHMRRAVALMVQAGLNPVPAPTNQTVGVPPIRGWRRFLPTSSALRKTERALHEYAGLTAMAAGFP